MLTKKDWCAGHKMRVGLFAMQRSALVLTALLGIAGAESAGAQQTKSTPIPAIAAPRAVAVASRLPGAGELIGDAVVLRDSAFVFKQAQGGSPVAGVLFGALGLIANEGFIKAETDAQAKSVAGFFSGIDLRGMLRTALGAPVPEALKGRLALAPDEDPAAAERLALLPYAYVRVDRDGVLRTTVTMQAEIFGEPGKRTWLGRYHVHMPLMIKIEEVQAGDANRKLEFSKGLDAATAEAVNLLYQDISGAVPAAGTLFNVISNYLVNMDMRRVQVALPGALVHERDGRKIIRHDAPRNILNSEVFGVHVYRDAQIMNLVPLAK